VFGCWSEGMGSGGSVDVTRLSRTGASTVGR
jgi:hypothetical protein